MELEEELAQFHTGTDKETTLTWEEKFDPEQPIKYLQYLDANNLYGWAMSRDLPTENFKWMISDKLTNWKDLCEKEGVMGCILSL